AAARPRPPPRPRRGPPPPPPPGGPRGAPPPPPPREPGISLQDDGREIPGSLAQGARAPE
ncbi:hypothetical protein, partial [Rhodopseudomonas sp. BAL398]|uniref:hypothetical protein n=1 Tax=Rhodopseudomonas sp. BAL398 TaxID=3034676 RepID=UPI0023E21CEC